MFSRMKKHTLFIFLLVFSTSLFAQLKPITSYPKIETKNTPQYDWKGVEEFKKNGLPRNCLLYTSPSPRDRTRSRMPSSA